MRSRHIRGDAGSPVLCTRVPDALQRASAGGAEPGPRSGMARGEMGPGSAAHRTGRCLASPARCAASGAQAECGAHSHHSVIARSPCDEAIQNPSAKRLWIASSLQRKIAAQFCRELLAVTEQGVALQLSNLHFKCQCRRVGKGAQRRAHRIRSRHERGHAGALPTLRCRRL